VLVLAEGLAEAALTRYGATSSQVLAEFSGSLLHGLQLRTVCSCSIRSMTGRCR